MLSQPVSLGPGPSCFLSPVSIHTSFPMHRASFNRSLWQGRVRVWVPFRSSKDPTPSLHRDCPFSSSGNVPLLQCPGMFPRVRDSLDKMGGNRMSAYCLWFGGLGHEVLVSCSSLFQNFLASLAAYGVIRTCGVACFSDVCGSRRAQPL